MDDKTKWEVERLKESSQKHDERISRLEVFQISTVEKLKTIFERLKDIEKTNKWVSQSFFYLLISGIIGAVMSLIVWLIQR